MTNKQKQDILNSLESGGQLVIKPTQKQQSGGAILSTLLASIGIPLAIDMIKKISGNGSPRVGRPKQGNGAPRVGIPQNPPPFFGSWEKPTVGYGKKKLQQKRKPKREKVSY